MILSHPAGRLKTMPLPGHLKLKGDSRGSEGGQGYIGQCQRQQRCQSHHGGWVWGRPEIWHQFMEPNGWSNGRSLKFGDQECHSACNRFQQSSIAVAQSTVWLIFLVDSGYVCFFGQSSSQVAAFELQSMTKSSQKINDTRPLGQQFWESPWRFIRTITWVLCRFGWGEKKSSIENSDVAIWLAVRIHLIKKMLQLQRILLEVGMGKARKSWSPVEATHQHGWLRVQQIRTLH